MLFDPDDVRGSGSRFTERIEFVVSDEELIGQEDEGPDINSEPIARELERVQEHLNSKEHSVTAFPASSGRGAEGWALGFVLEATLAVGGLYGSWQAAHNIFKSLRSRFGPAVTLSHGAIKALVQYDLLIRSPHLNAEDFVVVSAVEHRSSWTPSELNHTGQDMLTVIVCDRSNTQSWCYLVSDSGKVLHYNEGGPLPPELIMNSAVECSWEVDLDHGHLGDGPDS